MNPRVNTLSPSTNLKNGRVLPDYGFTVIELAVIVAIVGILVGLLIPALTKAKTLAQRTACLSNLRQLAFSSALYSGDNEGRLVESFPGLPSATPNPSVWVRGNMQLPAEASDPSLIARGQLYQYNNSTAIYRCPADNKQSLGGKSPQAVRSYSMNAFMGDSSRYGNPALLGDAGLANIYDPYYAKETDLKQPSSLWVLLDEDSRTISDSCFTFDPSGKQKPTRLPAISQQRHNFGFGLAFADGHSEIWHFNDANSLLGNNSTLNSAAANTPANSKDFQKFSQATAARRAP